MKDLPRVEIIHASCNLKHDINNNREREQNPSPSVILYFLIYIYTLGAGYPVITGFLRIE
jgi:hypothetical protein